MTAVSLTGPAREIRREIARIEKKLAAARDAEMRHLLTELGAIYVAVLRKRGLDRLTKFAAATVRS